MTVVAAATSIVDVMVSREGLGTSGTLLIIGPNRRENLFKYANRPETSDYLPPAGAMNNASVHYILPPQAANNTSDRHAKYK